MQNFDILRTLKNEVAKDDQSENGKAKTKELMPQVAMYFLQNRRKMRLTIFLRKYEMIKGFIFSQKFPRQRRKILTTKYNGLKL